MKREALVAAQVLDVGGRAGDEVIDADDLVPVGQEALAQVRADEARAAGDDCSHDELLLQKPLDVLAGPLF